MAAKPTRGRRASGLRAIAATLPGATRRLRQRRGLAQSALFQDWPAIVGDVLATQCYPQRLVRGAAGAGGTLHLGVAGPLALELQHLAPQVIERINTYFGFAAVARLTLHQVAPMAPRQRDEPADTHPTPDSAARKHSTRACGPSRTPSCAPPWTAWAGPCSRRPRRAVPALAVPAPAVPAPQVDSNPPLYSRFSGQEKKVRRFY